MTLQIFEISPATIIFNAISKKNKIIIIIIITPDDITLFTFDCKRYGNFYKTMETLIKIVFNQIHDYSIKKIRTDHITL